jgi:hypothetical protein
MGVAASLPRRASQSRARLAFLARVGTTPLLVGLVAASTLCRGLAGTLKETPAYFQDEYLYAELGRSLAENGRPLVRGADAHFPALLQPILTAPAWLLEDVGDSYGLVKWIGAFAVSLAAVPVFVLARRLALGKWPALLLATLTLATPSVFYSSWVMAEPFAYPLALAALTAGTLALARGERRAQVAFVLLAALATFARVQLIVLPLCFASATLVMGLRERSLWRTFRAQAPVLVPFAAAFLLMVAFSTERLLGAYANPLGNQADLLATLPARLGNNALGVAYASGWILLPGALLGLGFALGSPRRRTELAFAALATPFAIALLLEASLAGDIGRIQERYTFYLVPVLATFFGLFASRGWPARRAHALLAAGAVAASAIVPLPVHSSDTAKTQSAFLFGAQRVEQWLGENGSGLLAIALVAAALSIAAAGIALRPRVATPAVLVVAVCFCAATSVLAVEYDRRNTAAVRHAFLPGQPSWVDEAGVGEVALVRGLGSKTDAMEQLFWNRSVKRVLLMPGAVPFDSFGAERLVFASDGLLLAGEQPIRSALLVDEWAARVQLRGAVPVASSPGFRLWRPAGIPRLSVFVPGYYKDGWLAPRVGLNAWARPGRMLAGRFSFTVSAPADLDNPVRMRLQAGNRSLTEFSLTPGRSRFVQVPVCGSRAWFGTLLADSGFVHGKRVVSARSTPPRFRADPSVCQVGGWAGGTSRFPPAQRAIT